MTDNDNISLVEKGANLRFLIVEDEPVFAQFLKTMIAKCNPKHQDIVIVDNAPDAIVELQQNSYDVCFLDFFLKNETTGMDVLRTVHVETTLTAFVFVTVHDSKEAAFQALTLGAMDYLVKSRFTEFDLAKSISFSLYRKYREVELQSEALRDSLTGVGNKSLYEAQLRQSVERATRDGEQLGVLMIDLDGFKPVNDTYGHEAGDAVLQQVATRIVDETRSSDVIARVGGDEFAAVLVKVNSEKDVENIREKLAKSISDASYVVGNGQTISVGASIGAAVFPDDGRDVAELKRIADKRMYGIKKERERARLAQASEAHASRKEDTREIKKFSFGN
ncbi:MAG: GGDEF domain-containing response regulator [Rhodospirillales bacterium]|jgi:diguanylate cyclase (GGDEF)-like protein|nr:GGDEF domain-containing response regulator [Rhodospirillales bacterium]MBT4041326.1 GGDEF domain-containing response regulator [Rhodospirillales bacterium]MBT4626973.1 GGDEF domain-containing response regulator [Rhodospirillales bacterium]MBT5352203.1 GGDEF domain-containing response regulator [Rhodospirillales bacterium]MBT5520560.1 GGDEF domain-containing response regulator [Rhodospirillales bacterium]